MGRCGIYRINWLNTYKDELSGHYYKETTSEQEGISIQNMDVLNQTTHVIRSLRGANQSRRNKIWKWIDRQTGTNNTGY